MKQRYQYIMKSKGTKKMMLLWKWYLTELFDLCQSNTLIKTKIATQDKEFCMNNCTNLHQNTSLFTHSFSSIALSACSAMNCGSVWQPSKTEASHLIACFYQTHCSNFWVSQEFQFRQSNLGYSFQPSVLHSSLCLFSRREKKPRHLPRPAEGHIKKSLAED